MIFISQRNSFMLKSEFNRRILLLVNEIQRENKEAWN